jgi:hypothetical protein
VLTDPEFDLDPTHQDFSLVKGRSHVHQKRSAQQCFFTT